MLCARPAERTTNRIERHTSTVRSQPGPSNPEPRSFTTPGSTHGRRQRPSTRFAPAAPTHGGRRDRPSTRFAPAAPTGGDAIVHPRALRQPLRRGATRSSIHALCASRSDGGRRDRSLTRFAPAGPTHGVDAIVHPRALRQPLRPTGGRRDPPARFAPARADPRGSARSIRALAPARSDQRGSEIVYLRASRTHGSDRGRRDPCGSRRLPGPTEGSSGSARFTTPRDSRGTTRQRAQSGSAPRSFHVERIAASTVSNAEGSSR